MSSCDGPEASVIAGVVGVELDQEAVAHGWAHLARVGGAGPLAQQRGREPRPVEHLHVVVVQGVLQPERCEVELWQKDMPDYWPLMT